MHADEIYAYDDDMYACSTTSTKSVCLSPLEKVCALEAHMMFSYWCSPDIFFRNGVRIPQSASKRCTQPRFYCIVAIVDKIRTHWSFKVKTKINHSNILPGHDNAEDGASSTGVAKMCHDSREGVTHTRARSRLAGPWRTHDVLAARQRHASVDLPLGFIVECELGETITMHAFGGFIIMCLITLMMLRVVTSEIIITEPYFPSFDILF